VNWSKYSKPWDVIFGDPKAGIALFLVWEVSRDLPTEILASGAIHSDDSQIA
jgi:hypothetical protein